MPFVRQAGVCTFGHRLGELGGDAGAVVGVGRWPWRLTQTPRPYSISKIPIAAKLLASRPDSRTIAAWRGAHTLILPRTTPARPL